MSDIRRCTPVSDTNDESEELVDHERFKKYQSSCARANFLAMDRMDLQFGAKECCRSMSRPTVRDRSKQKRIGRFLTGCPRLVYEYKFQKMLTARCKLGLYCIRQTEHQLWSSHAREPLHQELEQDAIARCAIFSRVRSVRLGDGERRGNGLCNL